MAKSLKSLRRRIRNLSKELGKEYEVVVYPASSGERSRQQAQDIISQNAAWKRDPFFLYDDEQLRITKLVGSAYYNILRNRMNVQKAFTKSGQMLVKYFKTHMVNNDSYYSNPKPYHPKYAAHKRGHGMYDQFLMYTGSLYNSLRYTVRRK